MSTDQALAAAQMFKSNDPPGVVRVTSAGLMKVKRGFRLKGFERGGTIVLITCGREREFSVLSPYDYPAYPKDGQTFSGKVLGNRCSARRTKGSGPAAQTMYYLYVKRDERVDWLQISSTMHDALGDGVPFEITAT